MPHAAVLNDEHGDYLFQVDGGKAVRVDVTELGAKGGEDAVSGKLDGERPVVVDGAAQVGPGRCCKDGRGACCAGAVSRPG